MPRLLTVEDLPDLIGAPWPRPELRCPTCGERWSAHRGDYFWMPAGRGFVCDAGICEATPLELVTVRRSDAAT